MPTVTVIRSLVPSSCTTVAVRLVPVPDRAAVGTESALSASPTVTEMVALRPVRSLLVSLLIRSTAPYWTAVLLPLDELGSELTDSTVALSLVSDCALSVTVADWPFLSLSESSSEKLAVTCMPDGLVSTTKPLGAEEVVLLPVVPVLLVLLLLPEPLVVPVPLTVSPVFPPIEATVPSAEAVRVVPARAASELVSVVSAVSTCCWAWATCAASTLVVVVVVVAGALLPVRLPDEPPDAEPDDAVVVTVSPAFALVRLALAVVRAASAASTSCWAAVVSTVASTWPFLTVSPTSTLTEVTLPPVTKS